MKKPRLIGDILAEMFGGSDAESQTQESEEGSDYAREPEQPQQPD